MGTRVGRTVSPGFVGKKDGIEVGLELGNKEGAAVGAASTEISLFIEDAFI